MQNPDSEKNLGPKNDEIDLGQLIYMFAKSISNFFKFVFSLFEGLFRLILDFIIFVKLNFKLIFAGSVIGLLAGAVYFLTLAKQSYESSMMVKPNYGSTVQLYKNINYLESLLDQKDYIRLATSLNISVAEAESLIDFEVEPYINDNQALLSFNSFTKDLDTNAIKLISFRDFKSNLPFEDYIYQKVIVRSKDKYVFSKLQEPIISSIVRNSYYGQIKATSYSNLQIKKVAIENSISELDSLRNLYNQVLIEESKNAKGTSTNIYLSEAEKSSERELVVLEKIISLNDALQNVNEQLTEENEIINVVSSFSPIGKKVKKWYGNTIILGFLGGGFMAILFLWFKKFNAYLDKKIEEKN